MYRCAARSTTCAYGGRHAHITLTSQDAIPLLSSTPSFRAGIGRPALASKMLTCKCRTLLSLCWMLCSTTQLQMPTTRSQMRTCGIVFVRAVHSAEPCMVAAPGDCGAIHTSRVTLTLSPLGLSPGSCLWLLPSTAESRRASCKMTSRPCLPHASRACLPHAITLTADVTRHARFMLHFQIRHRHAVTMTALQHCAATRSVDLRMPKVACLQQLFWALARSRKCRVLR